MKASNRRTRIAAAVGLACLLSQSCAGPVRADGLKDARRRGRSLAGVETDFPPFG
jgi:ABC-type amino acid transport substrate-binding protein